MKDVNFKQLNLVVSLLNVLQSLMHSCICFKQKSFRQFLLLFLFPIEDLTEMGQKPLKLKQDNFPL